MRFDELPPEMQKKLLAPAIKCGPQKAPKKQAISIRLSADVLQALRATGPSWQARVDQVLRTEFLGHSEQDLNATR